MNRANSPPGQEPLGLVAELDGRPATAFVHDADAAPGNRVSEGLSRRFLGGKKSGQTLVPVALAHCVRHLVLRVNSSREPCELRLVEAIARNIRYVDAYSNDHRADFDEGRGIPMIGKFCRASRRTTLLEMDQIRIVPINTVDAAFLDRLAPCIEERFLVSARLDRSLAVPRSSLNSTRGQLFVSTLISKVQRAQPDGEAVALAITDFDLYKTSHRFVFGDADEAQNISVVSINRLRSEFYGETGDPNLLFQRTLKECIHSLGHAFGLKHCYNARCAMYYSHSIFETDNKLPHLCEICDRRVSRTRNER
jgi:archaemetzincin